VAFATRRASSAAEPLWRTYFATEQDEYVVQLVACAAGNRFRSRRGESAMRKMSEHQGDIVGGRTWIRPTVFDDVNLLAIWIT
jgi:hypothetical protein